VVVAVGLTVVVPWAVVDVKLPGAMVMLVAPVVFQLSVEELPETMELGLAEKDAMEGIESLEDAPQPSGPAGAMRTRNSRQRPAAPRLRRQITIVEGESTGGMRCLSCVFLGIRP
jgi:hypothetical protein